MSEGLDFQRQAILDEFETHRETFEIIQQIVRQQLEQCIADNGIYVTAIESRIKSEKSLAGKLALKGQKYHFLSDITDLVGARVITFYTDEVDKVSALVEKLFDVDWNESVDKRKLLDLDRFGYMSLHYVCRIPTSLYHDPNHREVNLFRFEIQMRTALQHVWATMNHDTGYKSGIEVPKEYLRNLNCIAGMLELADQQFSRIRMEITNYRRNVSNLVASGNFDEVPLNGDTFRSFLLLEPFRQLINRIAAINQAEIYRDNLFCYLDILLHLGYKTLGDVKRLIADYNEDAYQLALHQFAGTDLDIVAQSVAIQNLCIVSILRNGHGEKGLLRFFNHIGGNEKENSERARRFFENARKINII